LVAHGSFQRNIMIYIHPPDLINWPTVVNHIRETTFYADVINHYSEVLQYPDIMTRTHETTHMVNNNIRNANSGNVGFYIGYNKAVVFPQPNFTKDKIASFVPSALQGLSFNEYVVGMREWNDSPLYLYDEWRAYNNGGRAAVEYVEKGLYKDGWTNAVSNPLEFSVYACATLLAIKQYDPDYLNTTPNFLRYTYFSLMDAYDVYERGSVMDQFKWDKQDAYLAALRSYSTITNVLETYFNGIWLN
jgi:hypothetical protein